MGNKNNLIPQAHTLTVEEASKGGKASGESRRKKKTIQNILNDFLDSDVKSNKCFKDIAKACGITGDQSIKELVTVACILNTLQKGDVDKLQSVMNLIGESVEMEDTNAEVEKTLAVIRECAYADRDKS